MTVDLVFWEFGDGGNSTGSLVYHVWREDGVYNVSVCITRGTEKLCSESDVNVSTPTIPDSNDDQTGDGGQESSEDTQSAENKGMEATVTTLGIALSITIVILIIMLLKQRKGGKSSNPTFAPYPDVPGAPDLSADGDNPWR